MLDRLVTQIESIPKSYDERGLQVFRDILDYHNIILLGDPGMGKTYLFQHAAQYEGAIYKTIREFISFDGEGCQGKIIYLDALDELRSRSGDQNTVAKSRITVQDKK